MVHRHADIFSQQSLMNTCPSFPSQSGIGCGIFTILHLTGALQEEDNISADKQNGCLVPAWYVTVKRLCLLVHLLFMARLFY